MVILPVDVLILPARTFSKVVLPAPAHDMNNCRIQQTKLSKKYSQISVTILGKWLVDLQNKTEKTLKISKEGAQKSVRMIPLGPSTAIMVPGSTDPLTFFRISFPPMDAQTF